MSGQGGEAEVYTDGACKGNPGPGGWAYVHMADGYEVRSDAGGAGQTTNNRMELQAVIEVLVSFPGHQPLHVVTDSTYVSKGVEQWLEGWKRKGWRRADRQPVANADLWKRLDGLRAGRQLRFSWVKGHADTPGNQLADRYAQGAAERMLQGGG